MSAVELIFEEPPSVVHRRGREPGTSAVGLWLSALRDHPGVWAKYPKPISSAVGTSIRHGRGYGAKAGEFETRTADTAAGRRPGDLYCRYVGTSEVPSS